MGCLGVAVRAPGREELEQDGLPAVLRQADFLALGVLSVNPGARDPTASRFGFSGGWPAEAGWLSITPTPGS